MREVREALRSLSADWRFALAAIVLLSLTIGATTAVFAVVRAVILRPLPFGAPDRVAMIWQRDLRRALSVIEVAYGEAEDMGRRSRSFEAIGVVGSVTSGLTLARTSPAESLVLSPVSATFFDVVARTPVLGRRLDASDEQGDLPRVGVISHGLWRRRFGGDPHVLGRRIDVFLKSGGPIEQVEIVGVMPADFDFPRGTEIWMPAAPMQRMFAAEWTGGDKEAALRWFRVFYGVGRLRPGVTADQASIELSQVIRTSDRAGGPEPPTDGVVTPVRAYLLGPAEPVLWALLAGSGLMLLVACANIAGLQVSRAARRQRALAIRLALGARHVDLMRQTLIESLLLATAAVVLAAGVSSLVVQALLQLAPSEVARLDSVTLFDPWVAGAGAGLALATLLLCGSWPAMVARRVDAVALLTHGAGAPAHRADRLAQRVVVTMQVALALTLLTGTALFVRTVRGLDRTVLGFEPRHLLAISVTPSHADLDRWQATFAEIESRIAALSAVSATGSVYLRPLTGPIGLDNQPLFPGQVAEDPTTWGLNPHHNLQTVTPGYFAAMGTRVVRGRGFLPTDTLRSPGVVVVSESTARRFWPGREALGQQLYDMSYRAAEPGAPLRWQTVVGVVEDVRYRGLNDVRLDTYVPASQSTHRVQYLMVRTEGDAAAAIAAVRAAISGVDPLAGIANAMSMSELVTRESAPWRFIVQVFIVFAILAGALSALGLATVVALAVTTRRRELAIRAALGASARRLRSAVLQEAVGLVALGCTAGLAVSLAIGRGLASALIGVAPHDVWALTASCGLTMAVGLFACWAPARRAATADPVEALKGD